MSAGQYSNAPQKLCVQVESARQVAPFFTAPLACGNLDGTFFFRAVTLRDGAHGGRGLSTWHWQHASRTVAYGWIHSRLVKSVTLVGAGHAIHVIASPGGAFQVLLPASIDPRNLALVVRRTSGAVERVRTQANLVPLPGGHTR